MAKGKGRCKGQGRGKGKEEDPVQFEVSALSAVVETTTRSDLTDLSVSRLVTFDFQSLRSAQSTR
jgi:hypothetical protein